MAMYPEHLLEIKIKHLLFVFIPIFVFVIYEFFAESFGDSTVHLNIDLRNIDRDKIVLSELGRRYTFLAAYAWYIAICILVIALYLYDIWKHYTVRTVIISSAIILALFTPFSTLILMVSNEGEGLRPHTYDFLVRTIFSKAFEYSTVHSCVDDGRISILGLTLVSCSSGGSLPPMLAVLLFLFRFANIFTGLALFSVCLGAVSTLALPQVPNPSVLLKVDEKEFYLRTQFKRLRRYAYLSALSMINLVCLMVIWMRSSVDLLDGTPIYKNYGNLVFGFMSYHAIFFSLLIFCIITPVFFALKSWQTDITLEKAALSPGEATQSAKLSSKNEELSFPEYMLIIISPVLAALLATIADRALTTVY